MAAYFHVMGGSDIQTAGADGLHTLYLMNPNYLPNFADTSTQHPTPNMLLLNPNTPTNALNLASFSHAPPPNSPAQNLIGNSLPNNTMGSNNSDGPGRSSMLSQHDISAFNGFSAAAAPRVHYNLWGSMIDHHQNQSAAGTTPGSSGAPSSAPADVASHMGFRRPPQQGLSLSLSSQQQITAYNRPLNSGELDIAGLTHLTAVSPNTGNGEVMRVSGNSPSSITNGVSGMQSVISGSKYLRAAQELLDEFVNVGKGISKGSDTVEGTKEKMKVDKDSSCGIGGSSGHGETSSVKPGVAAEISTAQRQELHMKKSKLVNMLDEVELKYRQYHEQMRVVVSSFDQAAGFGAAKSYTAIALKTISKQFRCLKDAITGQIRETSKSLGEDDCLGVKVTQGSRLRYVDHHLRQQRALQQLGMIQHNAWRPQRGLPERAVTILRAWLFEHFLHPYPKDSDKVMLAKQTGLTRSQVSNWFINARVRLWKPMVEEMYVEEIKEQNQNGSQDNNASKSKETKELGDDHNKSLQSKAENLDPSPSEISNSSLSTTLPIAGSSLQNHSVNLKMPWTSCSEKQASPSSILSVDMDMKPGETTRDVITTKFGIERQRNKDGYPFINDDIGGYGVGAYSMGDVGRFNPEQLAPRFHGNGVSLTLGLPRDHNENLQHAGYLSPQNIPFARRLEVASSGATHEFCAINTSQSSHSSIGYEHVDHIQSRKRFAAQLLPDFVS